jgi:hypothetical protein
MGILDDAIREHLELKRAHGASEDDIRTKEAEAFGPVRQEVAEAPPEAAHPEDAAAVAHPEDVHPADVHLADEHAEPAADDPYVVHPGDHPVPDPHHHGEHEGKDPAWGEDTELFAEPSQLESQPAPPQHHDEEHHGPFDTDEHLHEHLPPEPVYGHRAEAPPAEPPAAEEPPPAEEPPAPEADEGEDSEDVLEETPEFLQDAPEHDRLWFEQKPPRDFDFGE